MNILAVANEAQRILFDDELSGQISDGAWENASPFDHWKPWCDAVVIVDPENAGRTFYARKDNYDFARRDLLDVVGERMVESVRVQVDPTYDRTKMLSDLRELKTIVKLRRDQSIPVPPAEAARLWAEVDEHGMPGYRDWMTKKLEAAGIARPAPDAAPAIHWRAQ
jgi:hypothetical protein